MANDERTHYDVLGVPPSANSAEIWEAHRDRLAKAEGDAEIEKIEKAYAVLSNRDFRIRYDTDLHIRERMRGGPTQFTGEAGFSVAPPRKSADGQFSRSRPLPPNQEPRRFFWRYGKRIPTTRLGWALFLFGIGSFVVTQITNLPDDPNEASDFIAISWTSDANQRQAIQDAWESQKATLTAYPTRRPTEQVEPEELYDRRVSMLEFSEEPCDVSARSALNFFERVTRVDDGFALAYRAAGTIQYDCWKAGLGENYRGEDYNHLAQESLSQFVRLADGDSAATVDDEVLTMLDALE